MIKCTVVPVILLAVLPAWAAERGIEQRFDQRIERGAEKTDVLDAETLARARGGSEAKAFGDSNRDLIYNPLTPCRLVDTRGFGAPIQGGAFAPNERRPYAPNGACAIPASGVSVLQVSLTTQNLTPQSGGYLAILGPGLPVTTIVDVFNLGSEWSGTNTTVRTGSAGQFDIVVANANAHVVVDVVGYFGPAPVVSGGGSIPDGSITNAKLAPGALPATTFGYTAKNTVNLPAGSLAVVASPPCPGTSYPIGGSCTTTSSLTFITDSYANTSFGWTCWYYSNSSLSQTVGAVAICMSIPAATK